MKKRLVFLTLCGLALALHARATDEVVVSPSASCAHHHDGGHGTPPLAALADGKEPAASSDHGIPRFTFWDRKGTTEWVQFDFDRPLQLSSVDVYWFDDRPNGGCRVPRSWQVLYEMAYTWLPVRSPSDYGTKQDQYNRVTFEPVTTQSIRLQIRHQSGMSGGILECKINGQLTKLGPLGTAGEDARAATIPDYPKTRLSLACLADALHGAQQQAVLQALTRLDSLAASLPRVRDRIEKGDEQAAAEWKQVVAEIATIDKQFAIEDIPNRLDETSSQQRLRLMIHLDWLRQDRGDLPGSSFCPLAVAATDELGDAHPLANEVRRLTESASPTDPRWMDLYLRACDERRSQRMGAYVHKFPRIIFTRHHDIGGQHYAYTEDVSDSPYNDNNPFPHGGQLCLLEMDGLYGRERVLLNEPDGLIRDPDVSYDGRRVLFARRTSMTDDDYHLYEMDMADRSVRQLTFGEGVADIEPAYLPGGDIVFNSSRCQQIVDCWWADVSNLYTCNRDGQYLRRISFDQVHTNYPQGTPRRTRRLHPLGLQRPGPALPTSPCSK